MPKIKSLQPRLEILKAKNKDLYWRFVASNGKEIARSSETYRQRRSVMRSIRIMDLPRTTVVIDKTIKPSK